jgi:uncharacterized protein (TIGR03083 family)
MGHPLPVPATTSGSDLVAAFGECWGSLLDVGRSLTPAEWAQPALCPGWTCRDALLHLTSAEIGFADWTDLSQAPWELLKAAHQRLADASGPELLAAFAQITERRHDQLAAMDGAELDAPSWTAAGPGTYRRYMEIRVFDHWAHEQDIRVPLSRPGHLSGRAAEMSLDEAHIALGYLVGKRAAAPQGSRVTIEVTGPTARTMHAVIDGRAQVVEDLDDPTATVTADFATFMLLCCGRIDPSDPLADRRVTLSGDVGLAEQVARNLAFTI